MTGRTHGLAGNAARTSLSAASVLPLVILVVIAARVLGAMEFGKFSYALALAMMLEAAVDFGLKEVTTREVARERSAAPALVANVFGLKLALAGAGTAVLLLAVYLLREEPHVRLTCCLLGAASILRSYLLTIRHTLQGLERFGRDSIAVVMDRILILVLGVCALFGGYGIVGLALSFVAARAVSLALAYLLVARLIGGGRPAFDIAAWRRLQIRALPFGAFAVVVFLYSYVDQVMLGVLRNDVETGLYNAAYRVYEGVGNIPQVLQTVLLPRLANQYPTDRDTHRWLSRAGLAVGVCLAIPATACTVLFAERIVAAVYGHDGEYAAAVPALQLLAAGFVFVFPSFVLHAIAISAEAGRWLLWTAVLGCLANIAMNLVLIPRYGPAGAAAATVAGEALCLAMLAWALHRLLWRCGSEDARS